MADMVNKETEAFLARLVQEGILTQTERDRIWNREHVDIAGGGTELTVQAVVDNLPFDELRNSQILAIEDMEADFEIAVPDRTEMQIIGAEYKEKTGGGLDPVGFFGEGIRGVKRNIGNLTAPIGAVWSWYDKQMESPLFDEVPGGLDTVHMLQRTLVEMGYDEIGATHFTSARSVDDIIETVMRLNDMSRSEVDSVMYAVENDLISRIQRDTDITTDLAEVEAMDTKNLENPLYAKNMRAYELLERNYPTKYQFDQATGAIFMTDGTGQVDRSGNLVQIGSEKSAELVGGWDVGGEPDFTRNESFDGHAAGLAFGKETGWEKMAKEMGVAVGSITDAQYFDVLDVINNKAGYGADASRYLSGQDSFLGGYESTYRVKVEETQARSDMRSFINSKAHGGGTREDFLRINDAGAFFDDMQRWTSVDARRPSYDVNDEWAQFAGLSPENVAAVQARLIEVGALEAGDVVQGVWGPAEAQQMYKWMDVANAKGLQWQDVDTELIREMFDSETAATSRRAAFVPDAYRPMDPARVELTVKDSIRQLLGRDATAEDLQQLGGYLSDTHGASYAADVKAARSKYNMQVSLDESEGSFGQPGAVEDVDYEARYIQEMEKKFAPQLESQQAGIKAGKQQDMGVAMSNLMNRMGGGI